VRFWWTRNWGGLSPDHFGFPSQFTFHQLFHIH
jgi:hypothetical protein